MYAIRSYYDQPSCPEYSRYFDLNVIPVAQVTLGSDDDDNTLCAGQEVVYFAAPAVITSYSIHYTKLYDDWVEPHFDLLHCYIL